MWNHRHATTAPASVILIRLLVAADQTLWSDATNDTGGVWAYGCRRSQRRTTSRDFSLTVGCVAKSTSPRWSAV